MAYYIEKGCIGCHYCELECPVSAIRIKDGRNQIDQNKCIECGKCVELCRLDLIKSTEPAPEPKKHAPITYTCDVLVMGAGGVGTGAAARAADLGMDVILIEAAKHYGGGTWFAHGGQFPGAKKYYAKIGKSSDIEGQVQFWLRNQKNGYKDMDKLRSNISANGEFLDWFDELDPSFTAPFVPAQGGPMPFDMKERHINGKSDDDSIGPGWMGSWITEKLFETAIKKGARYFNQTRAVEFIAENGKVIGVKAMDPGGEVIIYAKAFILGTGGYLMNDELMKAIDPDMIRGDATYLRLNVPTNIGDGHYMVEKIGGVVDFGLGGVRGPTHHPYSYAVNMMIGNKEAVFVNDEGERCFEMSNEGMGGGAPINGANCAAAEVILRTKSGFCYMITDEPMLELFGSRMRPLDNGRVCQWRKEVEEECALEDVPARKADTVAELGAKLGMEPGKLEAAVERWNELCAKGSDDDFGKKAEFMMPISTAPFYAFAVRNFDNGASRGGISIDEDFRVLDKNGNPFPGVYCAGDAATYSWTENIGPVGLCGGLAGSWASGYHIAELVKEYIG
ncbi:MAG: FAD-binding protein [Ruminococcaceae bacterium]|nr:FAD-binding protein [Oscillospiraceae bacterium]